MRLLANENFSRLIVTLLRERGHDVAWVNEDARGSQDPEVLDRAQREDRAVATFDKGFSDLAFRQGLHATCGVLYFRVRGPTPEAVAQRVVAAIETRGDWTGCFATVTNDRIRVRRLPPPSTPRLDTHP